MTKDETSKFNDDYRRILATANKLEAIQSNLESVIDFFLAPIIKLYTKLCNDCLKLLFECEFKLDQFRKAEELVWKRIYHDLYKFQKAKRQRLKYQDKSLIESHFISGIGFYSSLIVRLRIHYNINDVQGMIVPLNLDLEPLDGFVQDKQTILISDNDSKTAKEENSFCSVDKLDAEQNVAREWARQAIYRSLVYMGDLARYLLETSQHDYRRLAFEFYKSASRNQPDHGLPFNQLATLAGGSNHNLDAVCNYMRCCLKPKPFEGAEGNMRKIFDLNKKFYLELSSYEETRKISVVLGSKDPGKAAEHMMKSIIVTFIKLTSDLWNSISDAKSNVDFPVENEIVEENKIFFEILREALELEPIAPFTTVNGKEQEFDPISGGSNFAEKPRYVTSTVMYQFCSISIMLIAKCKKEVPTKSEIQLNASINTNLIDLVNSLALNLLHYSTSKCQKMILNKLQELRISRGEFTSSPSRFKRESNFKYSSGASSNNTINSLTEATNKRVLSRIRQRKAAVNYSGNNNKLKPIVPHNEDSDMSELEETALSTIDALEISSDMSEETDQHQMNDLIDLDSSGDEVTTSSTSHLHPGSLSKPSLRPTKSQNYELERVLNMSHNSSSLPVPDLVTGDLDDQTFLEPANTATTTITNSQSPLESPVGSEHKSRSLTSGITDKEIGPQSTNNISELDLTLAFIYKLTYLPTIKVFCDWLLSNGDIISANLQSFRSFCIELSSLVSLLKDVMKLVDSRDTVALSKEIREHVYNGPVWVQRYPLSCDSPLFNLNPLKNVHMLNIDFDQLSELSDAESGFITVQCLDAFFYALSIYLDNKNL